MLDYRCTHGHFYLIMGMHSILYKYKVMGHFLFADYYGFIFFVLALILSLEFGTAPSIEQGAPPVFTNDILAMISPEKEIVPLIKVCELYFFFADSGAEDVDNFLQFSFLFVCVYCHALSVVVEVVVVVTLTAAVVAVLAS